MQPNSAIMPISQARAAAPQTRISHHPHRQAELILVPWRRPVDVPAPDLAATCPGAVCTSCTTCKRAAAPCCCHRAATHRLAAASPAAQGSHRCLVLLVRLLLLLLLLRRKHLLNGQLQ